MEKHNKKFYLVVLAILAVMLILSWLLIWKPPYLYRPIRRFFSAHYHRVLSAGDINTIRPWMTFDYISKVFKLPADYLKNDLTISDSRYPNLSLESYAEKQKMSKSAVVIEVQEALHTYLSPQK